MKKTTSYVCICAVLLWSCSTKNTETTSAKATTPNPITGTWKLLNGTLIEHGDTTVTDYTKNTSFIKIINDTHFAFLQHDLHKGKDSAVFVAGGGSYTIKDSAYTEHLQYCNDREWEGHDFPFTATVSHDSLTLYGIEKVESAGVNRVNIERYVKLKE